MKTRTHHGDTEKSKIEQQYNADDADFELISADQHESAANSR